MIETVSLRFNRIEWHYLDGMIKYGDAWSTSDQQPQDNE